MKDITEDLFMDLRVMRIVISQIYRVSIKSFPDYKRLLQENYVEYKQFFFSKCNSTQEVFFTKHFSTLQHVLLLLH